MAAFLPVTIVFPSGLSTIGSLKDAVIASNRLGWPGDDPELEKVCRLLKEAIQGRCAPRVAFNAFALAAHSRGVVKQPPRSRAWQEVEEILRRPEFQK